MVRRHPAIVYATVLALGSLSCADAAPDQKIEVIEEPPKVIYTPRIVKVKNTTKYPRYQPLSKNQKSIPSGTKSEDSTTAAATAAHYPLVGRVGHAESTVTEEELEADQEIISQSAETLKSAPALNLMAKAGQGTATTFKAWLDANYSEQFRANIDRRSILVLRGKWDHAEHVLGVSHIPYTIADRTKLPAMLSKAKVLIVNCAGTMDGTTAAVIGEFVKNGGLLITTDWALDECVRQACPGYIYWDGAYSTALIADAVPILPENKLFESAKVQVAPWKLDDKSQIVKVRNRRKTDVLVRSRALASQDPLNLGILAATFSFGKGRVLHLVGHFDNNTNLASQATLPDAAPELHISLRQAIALNFVLQRFR